MVKLAQQLQASSADCDADYITLTQFISIFEKDTFGEKAIEALRKESEMKRKQEQLDESARVVKYWSAKNPDDESSHGFSK